MLHILFGVSEGVMFESNSRPAWIPFRIRFSEGLQRPAAGRENGNWFTQTLHDFHKFKVFKCCWSRSLQLEKCRGRVCSHWFTKFVDHVCRTSSWVPGPYLNEALPRSHVTLVKGCPQIWMICYFNFAESSVVSRSATIVWDSPIMFEAPFTEALAGQASEELQRLQTVTRLFSVFSRRGMKCLW